MKKVFICLLFINSISITLINVAFTQDLSSKLDSLKNATYIRKIDRSEKYIAVNTYDKFSKKNIAVLLDNTGKNVMELEINEGKVRDILPNEVLNQAILINSKSEKNGYKKDDIISYNIDNKNIMWKTKALGLFYTISPDGKKLITSHYDERPNVGKLSEFQIIDLETGTTLPINFSINNFICDWIDNENVLIYTWDFKKVENQESIKRVKTKYELIDSLTFLKHELSKKYKNQGIDRREYETKKEQLNLALLS